jgi:hypothetical protein
MYYDNLITFNHLASNNVVSFCLLKQANLHRSLGVVVSATANVAEGIDLKALVLLTRPSATWVVPE